MNWLDLKLSIHHELFICLLLFMFTLQLILSFHICISHRVCCVSCILSASTEIEKTNPADNLTSELVMPYIEVRSPFPCRLATLSNQGEPDLLQLSWKWLVKTIHFDHLDCVMLFDCRCWLLWWLLSPCRMCSRNRLVGACRPGHWWCARGLKPTALVEWSGPWCKFR